MLSFSVLPINKTKIKNRPINREVPFLYCLRRFFQLKWKKSQNIISRIPFICAVVSSTLPSLTHQNFGKETRMMFFEKAQNQKWNGHVERMYRTIFFRVYFQLNFFTLFPYDMEMCRSQKAFFFVFLHIWMLNISYRKFMVLHCFPRKRKKALIFEK